MPAVLFCVVATAEGSEQDCVTFSPHKSEVKKSETSPAAGPWENPIQT